LRSILIFLVGINTALAVVPVTHVPNDGEPVEVKSWLVTGPSPSPVLQKKDQKDARRAAYYTGKGIDIGYPRTVQRPDGTLVTVFDFNNHVGKIDGMARVPLNGQDLREVWSTPWKVDITHTVCPTENHLNIDVAHLWPNRLSGDQSSGDGPNIAWTTWNPCKADSPLLESGLRGPVQIVSQESFPMVDYHVHLKGGLSLEEAKTWALAHGLRYGIAQNCGVNFPVTDDTGLREYVEIMRGQGVYVGMQAEGREWVELFSTEAMAQFDYIFTDAMTWRNNEGKRMRLWVKEETVIGEPETFIDMLVDRIVWILDNEPIDIYANPTFLPAELAGRYDELWTTERVDRVISAAVRNGVAIEINAGLKLPKPAFIKRAKKAGATFSFGTNNGGKQDLGNLEYCRQMIDECGLAPADMFVPKPDGQKAIQRKSLPKRKF